MTAEKGEKERGMQRAGWMRHFIQLSEHISLNGRAKVNLNVVIDCFLIAIISGCTSVKVKTNKC